jgi:hypothetical protein
VLEDELACRWMTKKGRLGSFAGKMLQQSVESGALLALAFCNAHQLASQDMIRYERLEQWDGEGPSMEQQLPEDERLEQGVTEEVPPHPPPPPPCTAPHRTAPPRPARISTLRTFP